METVFQWLSYLEEFNEVSVAVRLILAAVMGSAIGIERGAAKQVAGMRTFALVCMGSALAQIVDIHCILEYGTGDPVRLAQGVISGIGFLGVGTIVVTGKSHVKGLTTAATLWTTAVLGISIGAGYIYSSVITFLLVMLAITFLGGISRHQDKYNRDLELQIELQDTNGINHLMDYMKEQGFKICSMDKKVGEEYVDIQIRLNLGKKRNHDDIISEISRMEEVRYIEEILY